MKRGISIFLLMLALVIPITIAFAQAAGYTIPWSTIANGGGISSDGTFTLQGTSGQAVIGTMSDGAHTLTGGFWASSADSYRSYLPVILKLL